MSFFLNPALMCDYYKIGHPWMQAPGMETVVTTWTARSDRHHPNCPKTLVFGYQYEIQEWLIDYFNREFFNRPLEELKAEYEEMISKSFSPRYASFEKFEKLHKLGYLPIKIMGVPEGTLLPIGIPDHMIFNTDPEFAWLPQYLEDLWSTNNWLPSTSATTAYYRRKLLKPFIEATCDNPEEQLWHMCGDFSLRGHTHPGAAMISGAGHLVCFDRTATIGSNTLINNYYGNNGEPAGLGTPSLEHSVVEQGVAWMKSRIVTGDLPEYIQKYVKKAAMEGNWEINLIAEMAFILYLIKEVQPEGIMTYVSDTYDYWGVVSKVLPMIKEEILNRNGCFSVRPDSGNPVKIICGDPMAESGSPEQQGTLFLLLNTFGSTTNSKQCLVLPPQIRMIYGDAITPEITEDVCCWCVKYGVSLSNICFGIGAYTYQYVTRDTRGYAIKATDCIHSQFGELPIYKQPKTDPGKKSPRGAVAVLKNLSGEYYMVDNLTLDEVLAMPGNIMVCKFENGKMMYCESFAQIRDRMLEHEEEDN